MKFIRRPASRRRAAHVWAGLALMLTGAAALDSAEPAPSAAQKAIDELVNETVAHLSQTSFTFISARSLRTAPAIDQVRFEDAKKEAEFHKRMVKRLNAINLTGAPHMLTIEATVLRHVFEYGSATDKNYWLEFAVTPYTGGERFIRANRTLAIHQFKTAADLDSYVKLLDGYALLLDQVAAKTRAQAERGVRVAKPGIAGVRATFQGLHKTAPTLMPEPKRLAAFSAKQVAAFSEAVQKQITERIQPKCDAVIAIFDDAYVRQAPDDVGARQYPGGKERYAQLIKYEGYGMTAEQIHQRARQDVIDVHRQMKAVRDRMGFKGTAEEFHAKLRKEPQLVFGTPEELERRYSYFMSRMLPKVPEYFHRWPKISYGFQRLDPAVDNGTRGGGAQRPTAADPVGRYVYPTFDLANRSLEVGAAHRIYHELVPGHVFQGQLLQEYRNPSNLSKLSVRFGGYAEGWANYGASLGTEMGIFDDPYDLYLELLAQANGACRSVIETGMNYLDMSLADARKYLRENSPIMSDVAINAETLRFGADNFGSSLAYWMGFVKIWDARRRAEEALGSRFNIRDFHSVVMDSGALPLDALDMHVDWYIAQNSKQQGAAAGASH